MNLFFHRKVLTPFLSLLLALACICGTAAVCLRPQGLSAAAKSETDDELYQAAVIDSVTVEEGEIQPLVTITPESGMVTWREGKVLLVTVNRQPEQYIAGETLALPGEVWAVTDREMAAWIKANFDGVSDWTMRLKQLVGVPPDEEYTHVSALWVSPEDIRRPAYSTDITSSDMPSSLPENTKDEYRDWFNSNILWSYFDSAYPWTRLGYTYDWAADSGEYGLTEFWVHPGAMVTVESTRTIDEFIKQISTEGR